MDSQKTQILEKLKPANNVLVTVSNSPSVDQLSAAIGLTLMLNHLGKHATAVFSGQIPSAIEFLEPEKTLERTTDSLRDFIIALDKTKADKLRYKVEDQMVKIFITPYRTSISDKDLEFSQGDFNVDVVMALGVNEQADLDQAITSHGRILHDATVVTVGVAPGSLGSINWSDAAASSLCEMMTSLGLDLKEDILDTQTATALLTGIVAETERFSNEKTSSETMQMSAKLLTAGANQQLVASQLQKPETAPVQQDQPLAEVSGATELPEPAEAVASSDGSLQIEHESEPPAEVPEVEESPAPQEQPAEQPSAGEDSEADVSEEAASDEPHVQSTSRMIIEPPTLSGTLTASDQANTLDPPIDPLSAQEPNNPMLSHNNVISVPSEPETPEAPTLSEALQPTTEAPTEAPAPAEDTLASLEQAVESPHVAETVPVPEPEPDQPPAAPETGVGDLDAARDAVVDAVNSAAPQVLEPVQALNAQPFDLNLGPTPSVSGVEAGDSATDASSSAERTQPENSAPATGLNLPEGLEFVEPQSGDAPTPDPTVDEPVIIQPTNQSAPPPVPPPLPMTPPLMPPTEDSSKPIDTAL